MPRSLCGHVLGDAYGPLHEHDFHWYPISLPSQLQHTTLPARLVVFLERSSDCYKLDAALPLRTPCGVAHACSRGNLDVLFGLLHGFRRS